MKVNRKFKRTALYSFLSDTLSCEEGADVFDIDISFIAQNFSVRDLVSIDDSIFGCDEKIVVEYAKSYEFCGIEIAFSCPEYPDIDVAECSWFPFLLNEALKDVISDTVEDLENDYRECAYCHGEDSTSDTMNQFIKRRLTKKLKKRFSSGPLAIRRFDDDDWDR